MVALMALLVGCSSGPTPRPAEPAPEPAEAAPAAPAPDVAPPPRDGAQVYVNSARAAYAQGEYQQTIALAERGLRINRYTGELYLVMAEAYAALGEVTQSVNFARLGLRYAGTNDTLRAALQALLPP